jgi:hypothetical protein
MKRLLSAFLVSVALAPPGTTAAVAHDMKAMPRNLDMATTKLSKNKIFRVSIAPRSGPARINVMHAWVLTLATSDDGKPVEDATIAVNGGMPMHGHGLPTAPRVTRHLGGGKYLVEGMKFSMTGWWQLVFTISERKGDTVKADTVTFNLMLK